MRSLCLVIALTACGATLLAEVTRKDTEQRSFALPGGAAGRELEIDNIFGSITVTAHSGTSVEMVAHQKIEAEDDAALQNAIRDVRLDITQSGNAVKIVVDGPFRTARGVNWDHDRYGYIVAYDFEMRVPAETALKLKTVNSGAISVSGVSGPFDLRNVNGRIEMKDTAGSGSATTVNGGVRASFTKAPEGALKFKTVNGELEASFPGDIHADVHVKTLNGDLFTDYEVTQLPGKVMVARERGGRRSWKSSRGGSVRIGAGGPEMDFETVNGSIRLLKR